MAGNDLDDLTTWLKSWIDDQYGGDLWTVRHIDDQNVEIEGSLDLQRLAADLIERGVQTPANEGSPMTTQTAREEILAAAETNGWTAERSDSGYLLIYFRRPRPGKKPQLLTVKFTADGDVYDARSTGPFFGGSGVREQVLGYVTSNPNGDQS